jgi:hypothetical protein
MKKMLIKNAHIIALVIGSACPHVFADMVTKPAVGVSKVVFDLSAEMQVRAGAKEQVIVEAEPAVLPKLKIETRGNILTVTSKESYSTNKPIKVTVTLKSLRALHSKGSGTSSIENFTGPEMDINSNGSGNVLLKGISVSTLNLLIDGSGDIDATGSGMMVNARIEGSGSINAISYRARSVNAEINGSGGMKVHADDLLKASISGAGDIAYRGNPKVTKSIDGVGNVSPL